MGNKAPSGLLDRFGLEEGFDVCGPVEAEEVDSQKVKGLMGLPKRERMQTYEPVSYTHLTLPTNREV